MRVPPDGKATTGLRGYLRSLRSPKSNTWYGDLDPRSWRVVVGQARERHLGIGDLRRGAAIVRATRSSGRYLCTLPRSGTNWLFAMLECGLTLSDGGEGSFVLAPDRTPAGDDEWVFDGARYAWPALPRGLAHALAVDRGRAVGEPTFMYGHEPLPQGLLDYRRCRPVVTVRDPFSAAASQARKDGVEHLLAEPRRLVSVADRIERFLTVWDRRLADPSMGSRALVVRYEDLRADPLSNLILIDRHWGLGVDDAVWGEAVARCSWEAMEQAAGTRRDTARISLGATDLPPEMAEYLHERCDGLRTELRVLAGS
ncbi:MAG: hypothetical protein KDA94_03715 [Acidimicrobiales bacterium]|nr:hypothetical protein [Acidimicrobiales bacterium]